MTNTELLKLPNGARFYRADMHIHSFGSSHDVIDDTMTPEGIVALAITEKLDVIAITDHNEINNVQAAINFSSGKDILVIPGIELSTPQGHLLCYFPDLDKLQKFFGRLGIVDRGTNISRCQNAILECLNLVEELDGFAVLAHVEVASGFEFQNSGNSPHKSDILCHKALLGIELKNASSDVYYSPQDSDSNREGIGKERIKRLGLGANQYLARVLNSDAHALTALGRNASGNKKVTRIKMDKPSFNAIKIAFEDCDARIRIEDQIPNTVPRIAGIKMDGGFLDGQVIHFSPNLNCIIGGRGTGKSTTFEAVKSLSGNYSNNPVIDSEVWPTNLSLIWCDQAEQYHNLVRQSGSSIVNSDDPINGPKSFQIESYSQGETERISKDAQTNPVALLNYLDRFIDIKELLDKDETQVAELTLLNKEILKASEIVNRIPDLERALIVIQQQLQALEKAKAKDLIELSRKLALETDMRNQISKKVGELKQSLDIKNAKGIISEIKGLAIPTDLSIGSAEYKTIVESSSVFEGKLVASEVANKADLKTLEDEVLEEIKKWKDKESITKAEIEKKKLDLVAQNITLDMAYIQRLANEEADQKNNIANHKTWIPHLKDKKAKFAEVSKARWDVKDRISMIRSAFAKGASSTLKTVLTDLTVGLKFVHTSHSPTAEETIKQAMGWKTSQVPRANLLVSNLSLPELIKVIDAKDIAKLTSIVTKEGAKVFDQVEAEKIITQLSIPSTRFNLEVAEVYDLPILSITKTVPVAIGAPQIIHRDFSKLSLGQQQSVLLSLMLSSNRNSPLIIDQPEDNLDGEFIYHSLVPVLRLAKERRQIIIVTHNSNIAVLGDAEQIVVLKSTNDKSVIVSNGSIDEPKTKEYACNILEGAKEAFQRRAKIYGI